MLRKYTTLEGEEKEADLLFCPFCGKDVAMFTNCQELEVCNEHKTCDVSHYSAIVCSFTLKGCGATTGFYPTPEQAAEAWNQRFGSVRIDGACAIIGPFDENGP